MVDRRAVLAGVAGAVAASGCLGSSGDDGSEDGNGDNGSGDDGDTGDGETEDGLAGEVVTEGERSDAVAVDRSARFEEGNIDEILIVEGSVTNEDESALSGDLTLGVEQFRREATATLELGPDESGEFELRLESVYAPQFNGYTLTVTAEEA
ncbi:hypothetical protein BRC62_01620 [Halobacteriales archaeon QH_10_67_13]|nr:MAG: hypothetical protein BRC62_01620 [Halobacteriales archaeon QH_10_67_13]